MDIITLALAKSYTDTSLAGGGAIKGKNCVVDSITAITGGHRVTFKWTLDNGTEETGYMDVMDGEKGDKGNKGDTGIGIASVSVNSNNHLIITYEDSSIEDAGQIVVTTATFGGMLDVEFTDLADGQIAKYNAETQKWENTDGNTSWKDLTGTLTAGQTEITLSDVSITVASTFEPFTDKFGTNPTNMEFVQGTETVLQPLVTQESELLGTVTVSSTFSDYYGWKAFTTTGAWVGTENINQWLAYEFPTAVIVSAIQWHCDDGSRRSIVTSIQYSNDGTTWNDCTLSTNESGNVEISSVNSAKYWRLFFAAPFASWTEPMINNLKFIAITNGVKLTFPVQSENLGVKVRVS